MDVMDVYTFGYLMTTRKIGTPFKKTEFYKRLEKRNEINKQLNESVRAIIHCTNYKYSKFYWRNCLKDVHDLILDKVHHYIAEKISGVMH